MPFWFCIIAVDVFQTCLSNQNLFAYFQLAQPPISDFERNMHSKIRDKMVGIGLPHPKSRGALLMELAHAMKELKEELEESE